MGNLGRGCGDWDEAESKWGGSRLESELRGAVNGDGGRRRQGPPAWDTGAGRRFRTVLRSLEREGRKVPAGAFLQGAEGRKQREGINSSGWQSSQNSLEP